MSTAPLILVVEDEPHLAAGIAENLEAEGYLVETIVNRTGVDFETFQERYFPVVRTGKYSGQILVLGHSEVAQSSSWHVPG